MKISFPSSPLSPLLDGGRRLCLAAALLGLVAGLAPAGSLAQEGQEPEAPPAAAPPEGEADPAAPEQTVVRMDAENLEEAIAALEALQEAGTAAPEQIAMLGVLHLEAGRPARALEILLPMARAEGADPAVLYNAGRAAVALGQEQRAAALLGRSVQLAPGSPARRELGLLLARQSKIAEAYRFLRPWVLVHRDDGPARLAAATLALQLDRPTEAEEMLSDLPQSDARVRLLWGKVLLEKGDPYGAVGMLTPLAEARTEGGERPFPPDMVGDLLRTLGESQLAIGEAAQAVELLTGEVGADPRSALLLARAQNQSGDAAGALATLEPFARTLLAAPEDQLPQGLATSQLAREYGRLLTAAGRGGEAVPALTLATRIDEEDQQAWQLLGQALAAAGRRDEAQAALARFQELASLEPEAMDLDAQAEAEATDPVARTLSRATRAMTQEKPEEALEILRQEIRLTPTDLRPRALEVRILLSQDRLDDALAAADRALVAVPTAPDAHYQRAVVQMARNKREDAEAGFRQTLAMNPDHVAALNDLAVLLMLEGKRTEARGLLERVLALNPSDPMARQNLQRLEQGPGGAG